MTLTLTLNKTKSDQIGDCIGELSRRRSEEELVCLEDLFIVKVL
jgi:hypothetical protein